MADSITVGSSVPRHIFIALQDNTRIDSQKRNQMVFNTLGASEVSLRINGHQEPSEEVLLNFDDNHVARAYHRLMTFMGRDQNVDCGLEIYERDFTTLYPIYFFSLEHLDLFRQSVVDIHFRARVARLPANGYRAIAVILSVKQCRSKVSVNERGSSMRLYKICNWITRDLLQSNWIIHNIIMSYQPVNIILTPGQI